LATHGFSEDLSSVLHMPDLDGGLVDSIKLARLSQGQLKPMLKSFTGLFARDLDPREDHGVSVALKRAVW